MKRPDALLAGMSNSKIAASAPALNGAVHGG